jgi:pimeloyl-ACP methyl ester carboxylesterase
VRPGSEDKVATPVVFVHGLWLHASSWDPWVELFNESGYEASAPGWPGDPDTVEEARANPDALANHGIDEVTAHYAAIISGFATKPALVGHSFGGLIVQKLLGQNLAAAAVAIDAAPIKGVLALPLSSLRSAFPALKNPANAKRAISLSAEQFRYAFANAVDEAEAADLYQRWAIPAPAKPLFQAASATVTPRSEAAVDTRNSVRGPLLLIGGGMDHTVPIKITRSTKHQYRNSSAVTDIMEFDERGHSLIIDHGWREIAEASLGWLAKNLAG